MSVHFDPEQHIYTVDGVQLPSVTEVCRFLAYDYKASQRGLPKPPPAAAPPYTRHAPSLTTARYRRKRRRSPDT